MNTNSNGKSRNLKNRKAKRQKIFPSWGEAVCIAALLLLAARMDAQTQYTYTTLSAPGALGDTEATGISGNNIVGTYYSNAGYQAFIYNIITQTYTTFSVPSTEGTSANGIDGTNIVGNYRDNRGGISGFLYSGGNYTTLNVPPGYTTVAWGISGNNIVGYYNWQSNNVSGGSGFLYNGGNYTFLNVPGAQATGAYGISGNNIVGTYSGSNGYSGFIYSTITHTYSTFSVPGASGTYAYGISGNDIVGWYQTDSGQYGFDYNGTSYSTFSVPGATYGTNPQAVSSNNIVGFYTDASGNTYGFLAQPVAQNLLPVLSISLLNADIVLTWPTNFTSFDLYQSAALSTANWAIVTNNPTTTNGQNQVVIPGPLASGCSYRLQSQ